MAKHIINQHTKKDGDSIFTPGMLLHGELGLNFLKGKETLYLKNSDDEIVPVPLGETTTPVYTVVPTLTKDYEIPANPTLREHVYEISIGEILHNVTGAPDIMWLDGAEPSPAVTSKLVVSIINNLGVWGIFQ